MRLLTFVGLNLSFIALSTSFPATARADDWSGWMGNQRDGVYRETGIIDEVPSSGLTVKWRKPIQGGYAGPAAAGGRVFTFDYEKESGKAFNDPGQRANLKGRERLTAFDAASGEQLWQHSYDCQYSISYPAGPRCTPTVDGDHVYILGSEGDLKCLRTQDGEEVWSRNLKRDFDAEVLRHVIDFSMVGISCPTASDPITFGEPGDVRADFDDLTGTAIA